MRVLNLGSDPTIFTATSAARARMRLQASAVDELHIISPAPRTATEEREGNLFLHPVRKGKWRRIPLLAKQAHALIVSRHIDIVSAQDPFAHGIAALLALRETSAKLNIQIHTDVSSLPSWRRLIAHCVLRRADSIRVVSEKIKNDLAPLRLNAPLTVLPIFVDLAPFQAIVHHAHPHFKKTILWVGRFEPEKDPGYALKVLEQVRASGIDAGLILLGTGSLEHALRMCVHAEHLDSVVEFPGWQDPKPYLAVADVVVSTSRHESYGSSIIEALAAGVPVVAPDVGVAKEAGAVVVPRTEMAQEMIRIFRSEERATLRLTLLSRDEWTRRWVASLNTAETVVTTRSPRLRTLRYLISGSTGAVVNIGTLYIFTHFWGVWYIASSVIAFLAAFLVGFTLQRTWTFAQRGTDQLLRHTSLYFIVAIVNVVLNAVMVYGLVEYAGVWYVLAQLISGGVLAVASFFIYRNIFL